MGDALAPWHIIILVVVLVLLFGARRLPGAAKSLGESMNIFKKSVQGLSADGQVTAANPPEAMAAASLPSAVPDATQHAPDATQHAPDATQQQLADLQRQVADLQRQTATVSNGQAGQAQGEQTHTHQSH